jgi:hypothetical protein
MVLRFLLDEHLRRALWRAISKHNRMGIDVLDVARVGDPVDLPLGSFDPQLLIWAERENRILVSRDATTLPRFLTDHLQLGNHLPGLFLIRPRKRIPDVVAFLAYAAYFSDPTDWQDRIEYIP